MNHAIDKEQFQRRLQRIRAEWSWPLDVIVIVTGKAADEAEEYKSSAMHFWLLGIEFPEAVVALLKSGKVVFFTSVKKIEVLRQLEGPEVQLLPRSPGPELDKGQLPALAAALRGGREKVTVGTLLKEKHVGAFAEAFVQVLPTLPGLQVVECRAELATLLAPKEEKELALARKSAFCAQLTLQSLFLKKLEDIIDRDLRTTNRQVCDDLEKELDNEELMESWKQKHGIDPGELDFVFASLQSGNTFEIKPALPPTEEQVPMQGTYLLGFGIKYTDYSSCIGRTLFVDPTPIQKTAYSVALDVHDLVIKSLKPKAVFRDIYLAAKARVQERQPALVDKFVKNVGFVMGLEFRDTQLILSEKCTWTVLPGMVFCISVGFTESAPPKRWAAWVADTVIVPLQEGPCEVPTSSCTSRPNDVMYELDDAEPAAPEAPPQPAPGESSRASRPPEPSAPKPKAPAAKGPPKGPPKEKERPAAKVEEKKKSRHEEKPRHEEKRRHEEKPSKPVPVNTKNIVQRRTRGKNEQTKQDMNELARLEEKQQELRRRKLEELKKRFAGGASGGAAGERASGAKRLHECQAYASPANLPAVQPNRLELDADAHALLVPIQGSVVPFHVSMIKNMARSSLDRLEFLRVNFFMPGHGKSAEEFPQVNGRRLYVKELSFRSHSKENLDTIVRSFKEVQKRMKQTELEGQVRKKSSTMVHAPLQLQRGCPTLRDLNMRPNVGANARRTLGNLEAHTNGFRFNMRGGAEKVDILYSQIEHVIYQPCEQGTLLVLFHLHLKEPMMVGKKSMQDIQFFTTVGELTEDLSQKRHGSAHDPDEILEEQREREMKEMLNKLFHDFARAVEGISTFPHKIDIPFTQLSFSGVPFKQVVTLSPCRNTLVALQEWPPFCLSLADVDIVVFERAIMTLREFDIVFVKKDYDQLPIRITTILQTNLETIKRWLGDIQVVWYSCTMNMQWQLVMKEIVKDTKDFIENGGWDQWFAHTGADSESAAGQSEDESDYRGSEGDDDDDDDDSEPADDADSDSDEPDEDDSSEQGSEESEGLSWDELERQAERSDRKREADRGRGGSRSEPARKSARKR